MWGWSISGLFADKAVEAIHCKHRTTVALMWDNEEPSLKPTAILTASSPTQQSVLSFLIIPVQPSSAVWNRPPSNNSEAADARRLACIIKKVRTLLSVRYGDVVHSYIRFIKLTRHINMINMQLNKHGYITIWVTNVQKRMKFQLKTNTSTQT